MTLKDEVQRLDHKKQTLGEKIKQHRRAREEILKALPVTTTAEDFQNLIRIERDKQNMYPQAGDWETVEMCILEVEDLSRRQARYQYFDYLGELAHDEALELDAERAVMQWGRERYPETFYWDTLE